jgi:hypothetical protein
MIISFIIALSLLKIFIRLIKCNSYLFLAKAPFYKSLILNEFIFKLIFKLRSSRIKAFFYTRIS